VQVKQSKETLDGVSNVTSDRGCGGGVLCGWKESSTELATVGHANRDDENDRCEEGCDGRWTDRISGRYLKY